MCTQELGNLGGVGGRGHLRILPTLTSDLFFFFKLSCIFTKLHIDHNILGFVFAFLFFFVCVYF